jgi:hypothetical protein
MSEMPLELRLYFCELEIELLRLRLGLTEKRDNNYIQDPKTGRFEGSRPSGKGSGGTAGVSGSSEESVEKSDKDVKIKEKAEAIKNAFATKGTSDDSVSAMIDNHEGLAAYTPKSMKSMLEELGHEVKSLGSKSSLKGIPFEEGGGYRVIFGGDGYFQYHPAKGSHHGDEYWKIANGKLGVHRYEMDGKPKE